MDEKLDLLTTWLTLGILNPAESASYIGSKLRRKKKTKLMEEEGHSFLICHKSHLGSLFDLKENT